MKMTDTMTLACDWYYANGENKAKTAIVFGVSSRTIGRWLEKYNQNTDVVEVNNINSAIDLLPIGTKVLITASKKELEDFGISNLEPNDTQTIEDHVYNDGLDHYLLSSGYIIETDMCVECEYDEEVEFLPIGTKVRVTADDYELMYIGADLFESGEVYTITEVDADEDDKELCFQLDDCDWVSKDMVEPFSEETPMVEEIVDEFPKSFYVYRTSTSIQITKVESDGATPITVYVGDKQFGVVCDILDDGITQDTLAHAYLEASIVEQIKSRHYGAVEIDVENNRVLVDFNGVQYPLDGALVDRLIHLAKSDGDIESLCNFAERLLSNPSPRAVRELYGFLEASDIEIDKDGYVICFKKVQDNYTDCYSGKFDNSVGNFVEMPRSMVDDDSNRTCSNGLHVCSKSYLPHFGGERILKVEVDPAHFVAIPSDYNNAKARVSCYYVLEDVTDRFRGMGYGV